MARLPVKVFIADDSAQLTEALSELVTDPGNVEVVGAADSADKAIEGIDRLKPDVVIVDLQFKDGSGFDVIKAIRSSPDCSNTLLVLFTNHMSREFHNHAAELGADFFFDKSRDHAKILDLIREKVSQRAGRIRHAH